MDKPRPSGAPEQAVEQAADRIARWPDRLRCGHLGRWERHKTPRRQKSLLSASENEAAQLAAKDRARVDADPVRAHHDLLAGGMAMDDHRLEFAIRFEERFTNPEPCL